MSPCQNTPPKRSHGMRRVCALYIYVVWSYFSEGMRWVCAGHLYQDMTRKVGSALVPPNLHKGVCAMRAPAADFGICAGYAPPICRPAPDSPQKEASAPGAARRRTWMEARHQAQGSSRGP